MKSLIATQVKDGWHVIVNNMFHLHSRDEVFRLAKEQGIDERFVKIDSFPPSLLNDE